MRLKVETKGVGAAVLFIEKTMTRNVVAGVNEMNLIVREILALALEIAPKKDNHLRSSGRVSDADSAYEYESHIAAIVFGDSIAHYAKYHENWIRPVYKNPTTPGTAPHFVERAMILFGGRPEIQRRLQNAVRRVIR